MIQKAMILGVLFSSVLLFGCNAESEVVVLEDSENEADLSSESNLSSELQDEIILSITDQTELDRDSKESVMISGGNDELTVSVSFLENVKFDDALTQQIVEDSIKKVSETENVTTSEENTTIKIE